MRYKIVIDHFCYYIDCDSNHGRINNITDNGHKSLSDAIGYGINYWIGKPIDKLTNFLAKYNMNAKVFRL